MQEKTTAPFKKRQPPPDPSRPRYKKRQPPPDTGHSVARKDSHHQTQQPTPMQEKTTARHKPLRCKKGTTTAWQKKRKHICRLLPIAGYLPGRASDRRMNQLRHNSSPSSSAQHPTIRRSGIARAVPKLSLLALALARVAAGGILLRPRADGLSSCPGLSWPAHDRADAVERTLRRGLTKPPV